MDPLALLEALLAETPPEQRRALTLLGAAQAALGAATAYRAAAAEDARVYVDSFPTPGRVFGDLRFRAGRWLALRYASDERRAQVRAVLTDLAREATDRYPQAAAAIEELLAEPMPDDPLEDELWLAVAVAIVVAEVGEV